MNIESFYYELMQQDKYFENFNENPKSTDLAQNSWPAQLWLPHVWLPVMASAANSLQTIVTEAARAHRKPNLVC